MAAVDGRVGNVPARAVAAGARGQPRRGYCLAYTDPQPHRVYVGHVGTSREWRRRGVASALLGAVLAAAGNAGAEEVVLNVDASSPTGAVGVYERAGFEVDSRGVTYALTLESRTAID
ncbi:GNAT family N-acetyltransferase [Luedemannella flava]